jgi:arsenate reductase
MDLKNKSLTEDDYKKIHFGTLHVFESVCFIIKDKIYIGNTQQNMLQVMKALV